MWCKHSYHRLNWEKVSLNAYQIMYKSILPGSNNNDKISMF